MIPETENPQRATTTAELNSLRINFEKNIHVSNGIDDYNRF